MLLQAREENLIVRLLICAGLPTDTRNRYGLTPLLSASLHGRIGVATLLLHAGADVNVVARSSDATALHNAARGGYRATVVVLLEGGADRSLIADDGTPHEAALAYGHQDVAWLLSHPVKLT